MTLPNPGARGVAALAVVAALLASPAAAAAGDLLWERQIDARTIHCPRTVAAGGVLFTWSNVLVKSGRDIRPLLEARRVRSGKLLWQAQGHDGHLPAGPIVEGEGRLFTAELMFEDKFFSTPRVTARDAITGRVAWTAKLDGPLARFAPTGLAAADGRLFLLGQLSRSPGSFYGVPMVLAYDGRTGDALWSDVLLGGRSDVRAGSVVADRKRTVVTAYYGKDDRKGPISLARTYDAATGRPLWQRKRSYQLGDRELHRDRQFMTGWVGISRHTILRALDADTGRKLWRRRIRNELHTMDVTRRAVVVYGRSHFRIPDATSYLRTFDRETGRLLWLSTEPGAKPEALLASPGRVFTASRLEPSPPLLALDSYDASTGRRLWSYMATLPEGTIGCDLVRERGVLIHTEYLRNQTTLRALPVARKGFGHPRRGLARPCRLARLSRAPRSEGREPAPGGLPEPSRPATDKGDFGCFALVHGGLLLTASGSQPAVLRAFVP